MSFFLSTIRLVRDIRQLDIVCSKPMDCNGTRSILVPVRWTSLVAPGTIVVSLINRVAYFDTSI